MIYWWSLVPLMSLSFISGPTGDWSKQISGRFWSTGTSVQRMLVRSSQGLVGKLTQVSKWWPPLQGGEKVGGTREPLQWEASAHVPMSFPSWPPTDDSTVYFTSKRNKGKRLPSSDYDVAPPAAPSLCYLYSSVICIIDCHLESVF